MKKLMLASGVLTILLATSQSVLAVPQPVPDSGNSLGLIVVGVIGLSVLARKLK